MLLQIPSPQAIDALSNAVQSNGIVSVIAIGLLIVLCLLIYPLLKTITAAISQTQQANIQVQQANTQLVESQKQLSEVMSKHERNAAANTAAIANNTAAIAATANITKELSDKSIVAIQTMQDQFVETFTALRTSMSGEFKDNAEARERVGERIVEQVDANQKELSRKFEALREEVTTSFKTIHDELSKLSSLPEQMTKLIEESETRINKRLDALTPVTVPPLPDNEETEPVVSPPP